VAGRSHTITIDPARPDKAFSRCREVLAAGGVIAYPTDTFYALGADPQNELAVRKLFGLKGRAPDQPILLLIAEAGVVEQWAAEVPPQAAVLMRRFWPGPLTIVFKARPLTLSLLTAGTDSIGLRVPGAPLVRDMLRFLGHALTGTSANRTGEPDNRSARGVAAAFGDRLDLILDAGETAGGKPSTIVDVRDGTVHVLRDGAIPAQELAG